MAKAMFWIHQISYLADPHIAFRAFPQFCDEALEFGEQQVRRLVIAITDRAGAEQVHGT